MSAYVPWQSKSELSSEQECIAHGVVRFGPEIRQGLQPKGVGGGGGLHVLKAYERGLALEPDNKECKEGRDQVQTDALTRRASVVDRCVRRCNTKGAVMTFPKP
eukprot:3011484-Amphidinium_carterae.1